MSLIVNTDPKIYDGKWEEFQPGVRVLIIPYTRQIIRKIMAAATVIDPDSGGSRVDPDIWDQQIYRHIIGGIEGLVAPDKSPIACSRADEVAEKGADNRQKIKQRNDLLIDVTCDQVEGFAAWALAKSRAAAAAMTVQVEAKIKNSKRSRGGKKTGPTASVAEPVK